MMREHDEEDVLTVREQSTMDIIIRVIMILICTMMKKYFAFISYKREDEKWAQWLQHELEHYRLPLNIRQTNTKIPKEIRPVFKDTSDLSAGVLVEEIQHALEQSKYLLVICSPRASKSEWVGKEVQSFIDMGRSKYIIPFIVGGKPFADQTDEECFPLALRQLSQEEELLGVNINEVGREAAVVKTVARMFGLEFDSLWQRRERERRRKNQTRLGLAATFTLCVMGIAAWIWYQNIQLEESNWRMMENQARAVAEKANQLTEAGDPFTAQLLALSILPEDTLHPERPYVVEAEAALRRAVNYDYAMVEYPEGINLFSDFSYDGKKIVSVSNRGQKDLLLSDFNVLTGEKQTICVDNKPRLSCASFSSDGKSVAVGFDTYHGFIGVYDIETGHEIWYQKALPFCVLSVDYSRDGRWVATTSYHGDINILDAKTGRTVKELEGIYHVSFSPNSELLAAFIGGTQDVVLYRTTSWERVGVLHWTEPMIKVRAYDTFAFSHDSQKLAIGTRGGKIMIWDVNQKALLESWQAHTTAISSVAWSPDNRYVALGTNDGKVQIWRDNGTLVKSNDRHKSKIKSISFSSDGSLLQSTEDNINQFVQRITDEVVSELETPNIIESSYNSDGSLLKLKEREKGLHDEHDSCVIHIWDTKEKTCIRSLKNPYTQQEIFYQDNYLLLTNLNSGGLYNWNYKTGKLSERCQLPTIKKDKTSPVFTDKERVMAISHIQGDSILLIGDVDTNSKLYTINIGKRYIEDVCISPDGKLLVVLDREGTWVYDLKTASFLRQIPALITADHLCISPNSKIVAIRNRVGSELYEIETGKLLCSLPEGGRVIFSPDCRLIALGKGKMDDVEIRDVHSGILLAVLHCKDGALTLPTFSPDGTKILISSYLGGKTWEMAYPALSDLIKEMKKRFNNRELTEKEKEKFYLK